MDNKTQSLSNQNDANLCLKCAKIRLAAGLRPHPLGELMRCRPQWGPTSKREGREGRTGRGDGKGGDGILPP